jgi:uncharacterized integral membrane protein
VLVAYVLVTVIAVATAVFALQNSGPTEVRFLFWGIEQVPLASVILVALAAGIVTAGVPLWLQRWRLRSSNEAMQERIAALETLLARREEPPRSTATRP